MESIGMCCCVDEEDRAAGAIASRQTGHEGREADAKAASEPERAEDSAGAQEGSCSELAATAAAAA